jgi:predicted glycosyltransferase
MGADIQPRTLRGKKVWIDLDNSPHVPFFAPIIEQLKSRGCTLLVTARDCFQVCELANLFGLEYRRIGRHYGKFRVLKLAGLGMRALQLAPVVLGERPDLALSHGSRAQLLVSALARVPSVVIVDYEFARGLVLMKPGWVMVPEVIPDAAIRFDPNRILRYPGIKEDVYVPGFRPDPAIQASLGLNGKDLVVTVRPPANEAHYHNPQSDGLFAAVIDSLSHHPGAKVILLPRNRSQEVSLRSSYPNLFATGKLIIPEHAVDGLNLIWYSDLMISGGGTMNREAAALGVPVYSIFRGKIGAVDRYLADTGRLVLLESVDDVRTKIVLDRRRRPAEPESHNTKALRAIVDGVVAIMESASPAPQYSVR